MRTQGYYCESGNDSGTAVRPQGPVVRQQVQCQGTSLQIAGVRGATGGLLGTAGTPVGKLHGYYRGVESNMDLGPIMLIIIK